MNLNKNKIDSFIKQLDGNNRTLPSLLPNCEIHLIRTHINTPSRIEEIISQSFYINTKTKIKILKLYELMLLEYLEELNSKEVLIK